MILQKSLPGGNKSPIRFSYDRYYFLGKGNKQQGEDQVIKISYVFQSRYKIYENQEIGKVDSAGFLGKSRIEDQNDCQI
ncbi:MAG: hypothetical protein D3910_06405 [Candidatus Electrothrix sp. ATG2]|nr:hypothetical protein [Candidatus Electrothrix sp. ATG2]